MVNIGNVWDRTTGFIAANSRSILSIALPGLLLPLTASRVVSGAMQNCGGAMNPLAGGIVTVVLMVPVLWSVLALTALPLSSGGASAARRAALSSLGRAVAAIVLVVAALVVVLLPLMLARSGGGPPFMANTCGGAAPPANGPVWMPLYGIVWLVVAVFVAARLTMLYPVVVAEGGVTGALRRAWRLSRGIVWKLIGVAILFQSVKAIAELAALTVFGSIGKLLAPDAGPFGAPTIAVAALVASVGVAFWVIIAIFTALLYRDVTAQGPRPAA